MASKSFIKLAPEGPVALSTRSLETEELPEMWPVNKSDKTLDVFSSPVFTGAEGQVDSNPQSRDRQSSALPTMLSLLTSGPNVINFFGSVICGFLKKARVFVPGKPF